MEKSAPGQSGNKLYSFAVKATDQSHKKLYRSIILVLLILEFLTLGFKATHEEKIIYEKYHSGLEVDTPVQFHAVSTEIPLYTQTEVQHTMKIRKVGSTTYKVTTYYAYLIVTDENGNQAVVVLSEGFNDLFDTRPFLTPQARQDEAISDLSAEAGDLRDEINGKDGKTFYGVISSNELDQQQVITSNDKKLQKILSLDTLSIYHDEVPETVTVEDSSNVFLRILILIALAAVVVFYLVMRAIIEREQEKVREREWKEKIQRLTRKNPPVEEKEHEQQETSRKQTNEDEVVLQLIEVLKRIKAEKQREAAEKTAQDDKQRKAAEKTVQKAEEPKPTPTAKETAQKEPVQPVPAVSPAPAVNRTPTSEDETEPEAVRILRDKICQKLCDKSWREYIGATGYYQLEMLQGEEQRYFENWPYASFELDLKTRKLWVDLFDGTNSFGYGREDYCEISAERFHEIAVECGMSPELQWFRTEEDWARLFDDHLQSVIDDTVASKRKKDAKEKEERRLSHGVELSNEYWTQTPGMWIESVRIQLMQRHGSSSISLTKKNGTYYLQGQALSSAESVWVERQVEAALGSHDGSTWSSLPGGDRISVTIRTRRWANVEMEYGTVPTKYYNLLSQLEKLYNYGSKDMRN